MKHEYKEDHFVEDENRRSNVVGTTLIMLFGLFVLFIVVMLSLTSCSLSFSNVMTDGVASDVIDSDPKADAKIDSNLTIPFKAL